MSAFPITEEDFARLAKAGAKVSIRYAKTRGVNVVYVGGRFYESGRLLGLEFWTADLADRFGIDAKTIDTTHASGT